LAAYQNPNRFWFFELTKDDQFVYGLCADILISALWLSATLLPRMWYDVAIFCFSILWALVPWDADNVCILVEYNVYPIAGLTCVAFAGVHSSSLVGTAGVVGINLLLTNCPSAPSIVVLFVLICMGAAVAEYEGARAAVQTSWAESVLQRAHDSMRTLSPVHEDTNRHDIDGVESGMGPQLEGGDWAAAPEYVSESGSTQQVMQHIRAHSHGDGQDSEVSFGLSNSTLTLTHSTQVRTCEACVQTDILADPVQSTEVAVQAGAALPPRIPRPAPQHRRRAQVTLRTRKLAVNGFSETPSQTVKQLLLDVLLKMNPRGKGCCYQHVGLLVLQHCVSEMVLLQCNRQLKPCNGWQCMECLALQPDDPDFDDRECCHCGLSPSIAEDQLAEEEIDSLEADVESPCVTTDSDSLTGCT